MARFKSFNRDGEDETAIDISPLIDCVFILLIFFIVTTTFLQEFGAQVNDSQPSSEPTQSEEDKPIILEVYADGRVIHDDASIGIAGVQTIVKTHRAERDLPVIIQGAADAPVSITSRVLDEVRLTGATDVVMAVR